MGKGRPRTPSHILKLQGTYRKHHAGRLDDTHSPSGKPQPPGELDKDGRYLWDLVIGNLPDGVLGAIDSAELFACCEFWSAWRECDRSYRESRDYKTLMMSCAAFKQFAALASKFGLSPTDRAKLKAPESKGDEIEQKYFAG